MVRGIALSVLLLVAFGAVAMAQGTSPIKVTGISVSPTTFKTGDTVTFTVGLENTSARTYGCVGGAHFSVSVYVFKASPYTVTNQIWHGSQALTTPMAAGEKRSVKLAAKWTVPALDTPTLHVMAWSPVCAPDEFGQNVVIKINETCVYKYTPRLEMIKVPVTELKTIKKP